MKNIRSLPLRSLALAALSLAALAGPASAQMGGAGRAAGWAPPQLGVRFGYDYNSTGEVVGAHLRVPLLRSGIVELVPNGDITFLTGLKEYQYGVDAVYMSGGRQGGLFVGGGIAWRNSIYGEGTARETRSAPVVVAGVRFPGMLGVGLSPQLEVRWTFVESETRPPRVFTFGVNFPFWGRR